MTGWFSVVLGAGAAAVAAAPSGAGALRLHAVSAGPAPGRSPLAAAATLGAGVLLLVAGPVPALLAVAGAFVVRRSASRRGRAAEADRERAAAVDALSVLAADLRAGRPPAAALSAAVEIASGEFAAALAAAAAAAGHGGDVAAALPADGSPVGPTLRALAACWQVCSEAGSGLAASVERLEEGLRAQEAQRRSVAAELAGPRATAQLLALLPLVGLVLAAALGAHPLEVLLHTPVGLICLAVGLGLDVTGVAWTRRLTERARA